MKIITLLICFISVNLNAQELFYNITSSGISIGSISINKKIVGNQTIITANSKVRVNLFITLDVSYDLKSVYQDNKLLNSTVTTFLNGKEHSKTITKKHGDYYIVTSNEDSTIISHPILYSGALLYFISPINNKIVYSEIDGIEKPIEKISKTKYIITNPKTGHTSIYEYTNEIASKIIINHTLMSFTLKLEN